jgi:NADPH:quinone reductase-like Zn-dependent oxidoreductase
VNAGEFFHRNLAVLGFSMGRTPPGVLDQQAAMRELGPAIESGRIRLIVDRVLRLDRVAEAHRYIAERGSRGKVILVP